MSKSFRDLKKLKERVANFKKTHFPNLPALNSLRSRTERLLYIAEKYGQEAEYATAWAVANDEGLPAKIREHPAYKDFLGNVALRLPENKLNDARGVLRDAVRNGYRVHIATLIRWHKAESKSGIGFENCKYIYDSVLTGKQFTNTDRIEIALREGAFNYGWGKRIRFDNPDRSMELLSRSAEVHLLNLDLADSEGHVKFDRIHDYCRNTVYLIFNDIIRNRDFLAISSLFNKWSKLSKKKLDPLEQPLNEYLPLLVKSVRNKEHAGRLLAAIKRFLAAAETDKNWVSKQSQEMTVERIKTDATELALKVR